MKKLLATMMVGTLVLTSQVKAQIVFSDNFNSEHEHLNYNSFANWTVTDGTVDVIGPDVFDPFPGNGYYVDLDGSTFQAGILTSKNLVLAAGNYSLTFQLGGSHRGDTNTVDVSIDGASDTYTLNSNDPLTTETINFSVLALGGVTTDIVIHNHGDDNIGAILDNVELDQVGGGSVPDGASTAALLGVGMLGLAALRRKLGC